VPLSDAAAVAAPHIANPTAALIALIMCEYDGRNFAEKKYFITADKKNAPMYCMLPKKPPAFITMYPKTPPTAAKREKIPGIAALTETANGDSPPNTDAPAEIAAIIITAGYAADFDICFFLAAFLGTYVLSCNLTVLVLP
jgi:hypothetical protein